MWADEGPILSRKAGWWWARTLGGKLRLMTRIRPASAEDVPFLQQMLAIAADWRPDAVVRPLGEIMSEPLLAHYIAGWPSEGDVGFVAEDEGPVGAAWWRLFSPDDPGYGFVDKWTPELSVGVVHTARGRGVGTMLLEALIDEARLRGLRALSLSVEPENPAVALYKRLGFVTVEQIGSITMVRFGP
jgi:GNAT superfamily N-acetyltransferase